MSSSSPKPAEKEESSKGEQFLRKAEREACWMARDNFWGCFQSNGEDLAKCSETRRIFMEKCPATWVKHFDRKFQFEKFKSELEKQGFREVDEKFDKKEKTKQKQQA